MELQTKPDFQECLDRVEAWWDGRTLDRPPVSLTVRSDRPARQVPSNHSSARARKCDVEYVLDAAAARIDAGVYLAENFPKFMPNLGPEVCATAYGAALEIAEDTSWSSPCVGGIGEVLGLEPDLDTPYWTTIRRMTDLSLEMGAGRWLTAVTDLHTNGDLLAALRDPQGLALDFAMDSPGVRAACEHITPHAAVFFDDLCARIAAAGQPCCTWGPAISRTSMYYVSCDFLCMISPTMAAETILPAIEWEAGRLDRSIFHLDGPGALAHLDALLALPALDAVQWIYGAGGGKASDWIDVYRRILAAGKLAEVNAADMDDARAVVAQLGTKGLWISVGGSYDRAEAESFLADMERSTGQP